MRGSARILAAFLLLPGMDSSGATLDIDVGGRPIASDQAEALSTGNTDLEWTRTFAANWATQIDDANSTAEVKPAIERTNSRGIDWGEVLKKALIGGLIGGLIGLVGMLFWRRTY